LSFIVLEEHEDGGKVIIYPEQLEELISAIKKDRKNTMGWGQYLDLLRELGYDV